jgi:uncharacterized protein YndB with AHSA1/START domain
MESKPVQVKRHYRAPVDQAFDAWLDAARIREWMLAPSPSDTILSIQLDPVVGGEFRFVVRRDGEEVAHVGRYLEIVRPVRLAFTWLVPKYSNQSTTVRLVFVAIETGACEVSLTHEGVLSEYAERTAAGWATILDSIQKRS